MGKEVSACHRRGQVGGVGEGRHLVAEVGSRYDGAGNHRLTETEGRAYAQQCHTYGGYR